MPIFCKTIEWRKRQFLLKKMTGENANVLLQNDENGNLLSKLVDRETRFGNHFYQKSDQKRPQCVPIFNVVKFAISERRHPVQCPPIRGHPRGHVRDPGGPPRGPADPGGLLPRGQF
jgi:hypothetical protein